MQITPRHPQLRFKLLTMAGGKEGSVPVRSDGSKLIELCFLSPAPQSNEISMSFLLTYKAPLLLKFMKTFLVKHHLKVSHSR